MKQEKRMAKRIFSVLLTLTMAFVSFPMAFSFDTAAASATSGKTGDCTWTLDGTVLTISGNGAMADYTSSKRAPWSTNITEVVIGSGVTNLGDYAFVDRTGLTSITIPDSVVSIGKRVFNGCINLTSITIPDSVTSIGDYAFIGCRFLTSITIPDSVTNIGYLAFGNCTRLKRVDISSIKAWCGIAFHESANPLCEGADLYLNNEKVENLVIPDSVTSIGDYAFDNCTSLTSITIPDSVTSIGDHAFDDCTSLTSITIPDSVTSIGGYAFDDCTNLKRVDISSIKTWCGIVFNRTSANPLRNGADLYLNNEKVENLVIPDSVTSIGDCAFNGCTSLTSITIPDSVTSIGGYAFDDCTSLTSITIPDSVTSIGRSAFYNTGYYDDPANWNNGILYISNHLIAAKNTLSGEYRIREGVKSIGGSAFSGCTSLTSITIPDSVTSISESAFYNCTKLKRVDISSIKMWCGIVFNGTGANPLRNGAALYLNNEEVENLVIPDSVTSIGNCAFNGCTSLTSITIPDSVTSIGASAFYITGYYNNTKNWDNGVLYISNHLIETKNTLSGEYRIREGVKSIGDYAFSSCDGLTSITIPDSVTSIGSYAFRSCDELTSITIPDSVMSIGGSAFFGCGGLTSVTIPDSIIRIGDHAFGSCPNLTIRTIDNSAAHKYAKSNGIKFYLTKITRYIAPPNLEQAQNVNNQYVRITLQPTDDHEYKCNDGEWQKSNIFDNMSFDTEYVFYQKLGKTEKNVESASSAAKTIHTKKKNMSIATAPKLSSRTAYSISLKEIGGYEYSIDGVNWQKETLFSGLQPNEAYTFYQRIAATDQIYESVKSAGATFQTDKKDAGKSDPPTLLEKTDTTVTLKPIEGYEYKMDDGKWQKSNVFAGLTPNSTHRFYQRLAETDTAYAGSASEPFEVTTYPERYCPDCLNTGHAKDGTSCPTCFGTGRMRMVGDADSDNEITDWDAVMCIQYLAGWDVQVFSSKCFDIDGDRRITDWDGVLFERYLAGWDEKTNIGATVKGYPPHDHVFGAWTVETPATCMAVGSKYRTCSVCDDDEIVSIPKLAHDFADWIVGRAATCTLEGEKHRACAACGYSETAVLPKTAHKYGTWITDVESTCSSRGKRHHTCSVCGYTENADAPIKLHEVRSWILDAQPTCQYEGREHGECIYCGETQSRSIAKLAHNMSSYRVVVPSTCTTNGYQEAYCYTCGYTHRVGLGLKPHNYVNGVCTVCHAKQRSRKATSAATFMERISLSEQRKRIMLVN